MRAARIHEWKSAPVVEEVAIPERGIGESLVRIEAATVSHLDVTVQTGQFELTPPLPYVPGCEGAGTVIESDKHTPGTQVIFRDGAVGLDKNGTWQEYAVAPNGALLPLDVAVDAAVAAAFFTPTATAAVTLFEIGKLEAGQTVIVSGASGAVGSMTAQLALAAGAKVIGLVSRSSQISGLPTGVLGVALDDSVGTAALARTRPADLLVDTVGGQGLRERIDWVRFGGKAAILGYTAGTEFTLDLPNWFFSSVAILPVNLMAYGVAAERYATELLPKFADGSLTLAMEEFSLDEVSTALNRLSSRQITGRAIIRF
ncbi:zinc-binding alcohol dehydrogenase family protein [Arthrobacter sp. CAU 1506]|uniref:quinone oxidoreductase family protein n=1 Tax=Arthrobacter sp. CAU 1506 TaxID=2560052 RepID=UPI0010ABA87D|nr:zinc-binding alcohol dehydrogenase family protein [Arthrobacter sp. CAU 1506]TJY66259.1 zinc-binding alcohol dehydrogenase family protein [Arthrobacter sp. CAU 1506]